MTHILLENPLPPHVSLSKISSKHVKLFSSDRLYLLRAGKILYIHVLLSCAAGRKEKKKTKNSTLGCKWVARSVLYQFGRRYHQTPVVTTSLFWRDRNKWSTVVVRVTFYAVWSQKQWLSGRKEKTRKAASRPRSRKISLDGLNLCHRWEMIFCENSAWLPLDVLIMILRAVGKVSLRHYWADLDLSNWTKYPHCDLE